ncbi:conjugal transfer protein TraH [Chlamydiales bacterium]|nr:conjugal transfer protein TraH [Chlamydiales bacterium]
MIKHWIIFSILLIQSLSAEKDHNKTSRMMEYYNKYAGYSNSQSNYTAPSAYEGQVAGYANGGGVVIRNPVSNVQPIGIKTPGFNVGCGGIDMHAGGISWANKEELINTLKNTLDGVKGYAFLLALETISPQIANNLKQIQSWANDINSIGMNSCELSSMIAGSVLPQKEMTSSHICRNLQSEKNFAQDYISARHGCGTTKGQSDLEINAKKLDSSLDDILGHNFNLCWEVIKKSDLWDSKSLEEMERIMTMVGTIVFKEGKLDNIYPPKIMDNSYLNKLLLGGKIRVYKCDEGINSYSSTKSKCLTIKVQEDVVRYNDAYQSKVLGLLQSISEKIISDNPLNEDEKKLVEFSRIPIFKYLCTSIAYQGGDKQPIDIYNVSEVIGLQLLMDETKSVIYSLKKAAVSLRMGQVDSTEIDVFLRDLEMVENVLSDHISKQRQLDFCEQMYLEKINLMEQELSRRFQL